MQIFMQRCGHFPMNRSYEFWRCSSCKHSSKNAHIQALDDYNYLFGEEITNNNFVHFSIFLQEQVQQNSSIS